MARKLRTKTTMMLCWLGQALGLGYDTRVTRAASRMKWKLLQTGNEDV